MKAAPNNDAFFRTTVTLLDLGTVVKVRDTTMYYDFPALDVGSIMHYVMDCQLLGIPNIYYNG